ncbi:MAG: poly(A) polymerase, partial [Kiritimatiellaeota bacterium]|nr:poly(A) polymerase [Kiritimatiellota bacterium]
ADTAADGAAEAPPTAPHGAFRAREGLILRDNVFGTAEQDAWRRDFTVNGLFYDPEAHEIIDYVGGLPDIARRIIRVIGDPLVRFREDPVRMVRAVRFAAACHCEIEPSADRALAVMRDQLALASPNRMYEEVLKLFASGAAEGIFRHLLRTGLFDVLFAEAGAWLHAPEGHAALPRIYHALHQLDVWKKHGQAINPALAWALAFGPYHEHAAEALMRQGLKPAPALAEAAHRHLFGLAARVQVFRSVIRDVGLIMAAQPLFEKTQGARADRFRTRHYFGDALVYLKLRVAFTGQHRELLHWWQQRL